MCDALTSGGRTAALLAIACAGWLAPASVGRGVTTTVQLDALKDTMIFQNNVNNGAGGAPGFFAGTNSQPSIRRGLVAFEVSSIPSNATITDVQLRLVIGQVAGSGGGSGGGGSLNPTIELHKLLVDWGEANTGASSTSSLGGIGQGGPAADGDATWNARFFDAASPVPWSLPGGQAGADFAAVASASLVQGNALNDMSLWLSTPQLVADVQAWRAAPSTNFGWMLINTNESAAQTFRGFYSRNFNPNPPIPELGGFLPKLLVTFDAVPGDVNFDGLVDIFDVNLVSAHWGEGGPAGDANGDLMVDIFDINLISANWHPGGGAAVPEPAAIVMLGFGVGLFVGGRLTFAARRANVESMRAVCGFRWCSRGSGVGVAPEDCPRMRVADAHSRSPWDANLSLSIAAMRFSPRKARRAEHRFGGFTLLEILVVIAIIGILVALLLPAVQAARESARRTGCTNNLKQMGVALTTYHDTYATLPAAVSDDWGGSPQLHSWAVFILPYVEQGPLYSHYDFAAGQNAEVNRPVVSTPLSIYLCPSSDDTYYEGDGHYAKGDYAAASGIEPIVNGGAMFPASSVSFNTITDGLSNTVLVGELYYHNLGWARGSAAGTTGGGGGGGAAFSRGVSRWWSCNSPCAQPGLNPPNTDCNNHCEQRFQFSSPHSQGVYFLFCDGHIQFLGESIEVVALKALCTIAGGETWLPLANN